MRVASLWMLGLAVATVCGCFAFNFERTVFPTQATDDEGRPIYLEDLQDITQDPDLTPEQMTEALRELGVENESLIEAIVDDGLSDDGTVPTPPTDDAGDGADGDGTDGDGTGDGGGDEGDGG